MIDHPIRHVTLRQLPLPAKLVLTVFLLSVGLGYFSALVQLHLRHGNRDGNPLPTSADVIEHFSGVKKPDGGSTTPKSKIDYLVSGSIEGDLTKQTMAPAFFAKSGSAYEKDVKERGKEIVDAEREGERQTMLAWLRTETAQRKEAYEADKFPVPAELSAKAITADYFNKDTKVLAIKTLIEDRCVRCHGGDKPPELDSLAKLEPLMTAPKADEVLPGGWMRSPKQTTVEALTQSTHAHLLSFSVLFMLTGLIFSFTSYPKFIRLTVAPMVLVAQVCDISCWWLARIPGPGPYFAMAIMATGTIVGAGLSVHILGSLWNMYGKKGIGMLSLLFLMAAFGFGVLFVKVINPALDAEKAAFKG